MHSNNLTIVFFHNLTINFVEIQVNQRTVIGSVASETVILLLMAARV